MFLLFLFIFRFHSLCFSFRFFVFWGLTNSLEDDPLEDDPLEDDPLEDDPLEDDLTENKEEHSFN